MIEGWVARAPSPSRLERGLLMVLGLVFCCIPSPSWSQPAPGLLFSEIHPAGEHAFVELTNYADIPVSLEGFHLANTPLYPQTAALVSPDAGDGEFVVTLPEDVTLQPGQRWVIALDEAPTFADTWGLAADAALYEGTEDVALLEPAWDSSVGPGRWQPAARGTLILFYWDGESDLVADADIVRWGEDSPPIDKSGLAVDGPDEGGQPTTYLDELIAEQQWPLSPPGTMTLVRTLVEEGELQTESNGLGGHNEPSEPWPRNFTTSQLATPGGANQVGFALSGTVTRDSEPVAGSTVAIAELGLAQDTDDAGQFDFGLIPVGFWTLRATHGSTTTSITVLVSDSPVSVSVSLQPSASIRGRIELSDATAPQLAGTAVALQPGDFSAVTDTDGDFHFEGLSPGAYRLTASREGYQERVVESISTSGDAPVQLMLFPEDAVSLVVELRASGGPLPPALLVELENQNTGVEYAALTESEGQLSVEFERVDPGLYTLSAEGPGLEPLEIPGLRLTRSTSVVLRPVETVLPEDSRTEVSCSVRTISSSRGSGHPASRTGAVWLLVLAVGILIWRERY